MFYTIKWCYETTKVLLKINHYKEWRTWGIISRALEVSLCFQNVVALVMIIVKWAIPDMSGDLRDRIRREAYVINSFILEETRARSAREPAAAAPPAAVECAARPQGHPSTLSTPV